MKRLFNLILIFSVQILYAQADIYELNLPEVPSSPAFILMDVSPSNIESPQTLSDLELSLQNNTNNFTAIPKNYSLSISPYWLLKYKETAYSDFSSNEIAQNILQSFQISIGVADKIDETINESRLGVGLKISLLRGTINKGIERNYFEKLRGYNTEIQKLQETAEKEDPYIISLEETKLNLVLKLQDLNSLGKTKDDNEVKNLHISIEDIDKKISTRQEELSRDIENSYVERLKSELKDVKLRREGAFVNIAGGWSWDFNDSFNNVKFYRGGVWVDAGWQGERINWISVIRFLGHEEMVTNAQENSLTATNFSTFDFGLKFDYDVGQLASVSGEFLMRSVPNTEMEPSQRAILNVAYNITNDLMLNLSYGKDFDNFYNYPNDMVALLNLVIGVGNKKKIDLSK